MYNKKLINKKVMYVLNKMKTQKINKNPPRKKIEGYDLRIYTRNMSTTWY